MGILRPGGGGGGGGGGGLGLRESVVLMESRIATGERRC